MEHKKSRTQVQALRNLIKKFNDVAKEVSETLTDDHASDKLEIFYHIRYACGLLRDVHAIEDSIQNPGKMMAEFTPPKAKDV